MLPCALLMRAHDDACDASLPARYAPGGRVVRRVAKSRPGQAATWRPITTVTGWTKQGLVAGGRTRSTGPACTATIRGCRPRVRALQARAKQALNPRAYSYVAGGRGRRGHPAGQPRGVRPVGRRPPGAAGRRAARDTSRRAVRTAAARPAAARAGRRAGTGARRGRPARWPAPRRSSACRWSSPTRRRSSMEECAAAMGDAPRWFQLYWSTSDELVESLVGAGRGGRLRRAGRHARHHDARLAAARPRPRATCRSRSARASRSTRPTRCSGGWSRERAARPPARREPRPRPTPAAVKALVGMAKAWPGSFRDNLRSPLPRAAVETFLDIYSRPSITWADLAWLRSRTRLPILLKGVLHPDDARRALDEGVDGVVVSTHGGRQVDRVDRRARRAARRGGRDRRARAGAARQRHPQRRRRVHRRRARRRPRCCSAGRTRGGSRWPATRACAQVIAT